MPPINEDRGGIDYVCRERSKRPARIDTKAATMPNPGASLSVGVEVVCVGVSVWGVSVAVGSEVSVGPEVAVGPGVAVAV